MLYSKQNDGVYFFFNLLAILPFCLISVDFPVMGGEGVLRISSNGDDRMGTKIKIKKNPWTKNDDNLMSLANLDVA